MPSELIAFQQAVIRYFAARPPFKPTKGTDNGTDIYSLRSGDVKVTANIAPTDDRISVKLTIAREVPGGPTPAFDEIRSRHEADLLPGGKPRWTRDSGDKESRVQLARTYIDVAPVTLAKYCHWLEENGRTFVTWADEASELMK